MESSRLLAADSAPRRRGRGLAAISLLALVALAAHASRVAPTSSTLLSVSWNHWKGHSSATKKSDDDSKTTAADDDKSSRKSSGGGSGHSDDEKSTTTDDDAAEKVTANDDNGDLRTRHSHIDSGGDDDAAKSTRWKPLNDTATNDDGSRNRTDGSDTPHLIFFYIDDQGFNDMGPNSTDLWWATPTILGLHSTGGIWLDNYYGQHICTPSRAALLTGLYPSHSGMQHSMISGNTMWGLPLQHKLLPEYLKEVASYRTHMVGKWHLGHFSLAHTPKLRGFDTFFGFFSGYESYYGHVSEVSAGCLEYDQGCWYDMRNEGEVVKSGDYGPYMMMDTVDELVASHANEYDPDAHPFFLYYALPLVHEPVQPPADIMLDPKWADRLALLDNTHRQAFAGMTLALDKAVDRLVGALSSADMFDDTVIVLASDNGANAMIDGSGSNWPLRGGKGFLFEGGMRVHSMLYAPKLLPSHTHGRHYSNLFHVTDWLPTMIGGMLGNESAVDGMDLDGANHWQAFKQLGKNGATSLEPRKEMLYNVDGCDFSTGSALRVGKYKLIEDVQFLPAWPAPRAASLQRTVSVPEDVHFWWNRSHDDFLFDLEADPTESHNLKDRLPTVLDSMKALLQEYRDSMVTSAYCGVDDSLTAERTFEKDQFLGPWRDANFKCGEPQLCVDVDVAPLDDTTADDGGRKHSSESDDSSSGTKSGKGVTSEAQPDAPAEAPSGTTARRLQFMKDYCSYHLFPYEACESVGLGYTWHFHQATATSPMHI